MQHLLRTLSLLVVLLLTFLTGQQQARRNNKKISLNLKKLSKLENDAVLSGYEDSYEHCQQSFKYEQWNCPKPLQVKNAKHPISFTNIYKDATKEASYIYSLVAAGVTHYVIRACQQGRNKNCQCDQENQPKNGLGAPVVMCKAMIEHGSKRARRILKQMDYKKVNDPLRRAFNLKNAVTGLQVYRGSIYKECRCSGVSGHCTVQSCWQTTPPSLKIPSMRLKELYNEAIKLKASDIIVNKPTVYTAKNPARNNRPTRTLLGNSNDTRLVYISDSPNYCKPDTILGITGTLNRECERNSCTKLCSNCGHRKHSVVRKVVNNKCNCKFHWCCKVTCSTCVEKKLVTKCRPSASN